MSYYKSRPRRSRAQRKARVAARGYSTRAEKLAAQKLESAIATMAVNVRQFDILLLRSGMEVVVEEVRQDSLVVTDLLSRSEEYLISRSQVRCVVGYLRT